MLLYQNTNTVLDSRHKPTAVVTQLARHLVIRETFSTIFARGTEIL